WEVGRVDRGCYGPGAGSPADGDNRRCSQIVDLRHPGNADEPDQLAHAERVRGATGADGHNSVGALGDGGNGVGGAGAEKHPSRRYVVDRIVAARLTLGKVVDRPYDCDGHGSALSCTRSSTEGYRP